MKLTYQTGVAGLIQLAVMTLLNVANAINSSVSQCFSSSVGSNCVENIILSLLYLMVVTFWFAFVWIVAAAAQDRRSRKLALILMGAEFMVVVISLFNAKHHSSVLGLVTSLVDAGLAVWVLLLASRIARSGGGRVSVGGRGRQKRLAKD